MAEKTSTYNAHISRDSLFNKWHWENWTDTCRKMKLDHRITQHTRINSKWLKNFYVRHKQNPKRNIGSKILDIVHNNFLSPQARETKEKINNWDYIKLKTFCTANETINKMKRQPNSKMGKGHE